MKENLEIRKIDDNIVLNDRLIKGKAIVFNQRSNDLGDFYEVILPTAISIELLNNSDIKVYLDHNKERGILARSKYGKGSLKYSIDESGVYYEFEAPNTELGNEVVEGLKRGDYSESSFGFIVNKDRWERQNDGSMIRYIIEIKCIKDFSIVADAAYNNTDVAVASRSLENAIEEDKLRDKELNDYYNELKAILK